MLVIWSAHLLP